MNPWNTRPRPTSSSVPPRCLFLVRVAAALPLVFIYFVGLLCGRRLVGNWLMCSRKVRRQGAGDAFGDNALNSSTLRSVCEAEIH